LNPGSEDGSGSLNDACLAGLGREDGSLSEEPLGLEDESLGGEFGSNEYLDDRVSDIVCLFGVVY
jgi:hypothetical protein